MKNWNFTTENVFDSIYCNIVFVLSFKNYIDTDHIDFTIYFKKHFNKVKYIYIAGS